MSEHAHVHATFSRNGSSSHVSTAQYGTGSRTQLRPAAAIAMKSFSVCGRRGRSISVPLSEARRGEGRKGRTRRTMKVS